MRELDKSYDVIDRVQEELTARMSDQQFLEGVLGGILGAGRAVFSGVFQVFTVLVLTLYFLSSLPRVKHGAYAHRPLSRRTRVESLSEEIMRRVGSYAIGQVAIATLNAVLSYVMMRIVGIPYAAVLAVTVGLLGLIPMIGATLGAVVVVHRRLLRRPEQGPHRRHLLPRLPAVENYVVAPRIMQRTVSVPGPVTIVAALAGGALLGVLGRCSPSPSRPACCCSTRRSSSPASTAPDGGPRRSRREVDLGTASVSARRVRACACRATSTGCASAGAPGCRRRPGPARRRRAACRPRCPGGTPGTGTPASTTRR